MCTGRCSRLISICLFSLVCISVLCNILLFFPGWSHVYLKENHLTEEVKYLGGLIGGGLMIFFPAALMYRAGGRGCCANELGMFWSVLVAFVGVVGALYCLLNAMFGLQNGPYCRMQDLTWETPFKNRSESYLKHRDWWSVCVEPEGVVQFNAGLFGTLVVTSFLQMILCGSQMINGVCGCLFGTCK